MVKYFKIRLDLLYSSVNEELEENKKTSKWWKDEQFVDGLNKEYESGKMEKQKDTQLIM